MTDKAISPLRQRMIEDMTIRKLAPKTQHDYVQRVKHFAAFLSRSPDTASFEDVRRYQLHLAESGAGVPILNQSVSTLRFFFRVTLGRADIVNHTQFIHVPRKLPVVLSPEEVARFLDAAPGLKYKVALSVALPQTQTCGNGAFTTVSCQQETSITDGGSVSGDRKLKESTLRVARGRPQPSVVGFGGGFCLPAWPTAPGLAQPFACREPIDRRTWCTLAVALRAMRVPMMHVRIILVIVIRDVGYGLSLRASIRRARVVPGIARRAREGRRRLCGSCGKHSATSSRGTIPRLTDAQLKIAKGFKAL
jgi:hypothetical protein